MPIVSTATRSNRRGLSFSMFVLPMLLLLGTSVVVAQPNIKYNFTGTNHAEVGRWHPANMEFKVWDISGQAFTTYTLGTSTSKPAPGDFNGDGKTDAGVFLSGVWTYKTSPGATAQTITMSSFVAGDIPAAGDFDGDGKTDAAIFRPSTGNWLIRQSSNQTEITVAFGQAGDIPVVGDFDGDGKSDCTIYRPSTGVWWVRRSTDFAFLAYQWGVATDIPLHGDFDGDGKSDITVFRPTDGSWYVLKSSSGYTTFDIHNWGNWADQPVPADYDNDGKADVAIWRETTGQWYILRSVDGGTDIIGLGVAGDTAIPSSYTKQIGGEVSDYAMASARLSPKNATGGTDYYSRNFGWGTSLVGLSGRSGMDAGLGLSYNSHVWINVDSAMYFDPDTSNVAPGFRFGPPVIEPVYFNAPPQTKGGYAYIMVTPDGRRVQFKQTLASNTYFTADSSYAKLTTKGAENPNDPVEDVDLTVTASDGTAMKFEWTLGGYRCKRVTDRNGNYITYAYDVLGKLTSMTDTLGRVINVGYNGDGRPAAITQQWSTGLHTYATFSYATKTVATSFAIPAYGPPNGTSVTVLDKVTYADGSKTKFTYDGYLQVTEVENLANNNSLLNLTAPSYATSGTDVPRMTQTAITTSNFNGGGNNTVTVTNSTPAASTFAGPYGNESTSVVQVGVSPHPNGLYSRIHYGPTGWKEGLTIATEDCVSDCSNGRKRWTWNQWTQDSTTVSFITNPRITETRVGDSVNTRKTEIGYTANQAPDTYRLPSSVLVTNITTGAQIASTSMAYVTSSAYTDRRILRLPSFVTTSGWNSETNNLQAASSTSYYYDEGDFTGAGQNISASQHDSEYGASLLTGRGNVTRIRRNEVGGGNYTDTELRYNVTGSPVKQIDALDRETSISYADSFSGSPPSPTYAYPTSITDPGGYTSSISYRYDMGANVSASSPNGFSSTRTFDSIGRLQQQSVTGGAYTRYEYFNNGRQFKTFSTITDGLGETESESWTDGAGRTYQSRSELPNSVGGWSAVKTTYDILGRVTEQSVPTEVNSSWNPTGDDSGWTSSSTTYDWKGRVTNTTPAGASGDANTIIAYEGCGCAGGQITTVLGPMVQRDDNPALSARRKQKSYTDISGRTWKTESFNWDNAVYSTNILHFNGRDRVTQATVTEASTSVSRVTTMAYDGYGRLTTKHVPQQTAPTTYNYNADDSIQSVTDARGATTAYIYGLPASAEKRALVTNVTYSAPSGITVPANVSFQYDSVGNRTQMNDGLGVQTYSYNSLSQLTSETRQFNESLPLSPQSNNNFTIGYSYSIGGQLKSYTEPYGVTVNYSMDKIGRLTEVAPSTAFGTTASFVNNIQHRAFGGIKHMQYGNGVVTNTTFNERLQPSTVDVATSSVDVMEKTYQYYNDGALKHVDDALNWKFDRLNTYDHQGRLKQGKSSTEANGIEITDTPGQTNNLPYRQDYTYNAFGETTHRYNLQWGAVTDANVSYSYSNGRVTNSGWTHDVDGRVTHTNGADGLSDFQYDAAGQMGFKHDRIEPDVYEKKMWRHYNGDGRELKQVPDRCVIPEPVPPDPPASVCSWEDDPTDTRFFIRSTVMGGEVVAEAISTGDKSKRMVLAGGEIVAYLTTRPGGNDAAHFRQTDALGISERVTRATPEDIFGVSETGYIDPRHTERDPMGGNVGTVTSHTPVYWPVNNQFQPIDDDSPVYINGERVSFSLDGVSMSSQVASAYINSVMIGGVNGLSQIIMRQNDARFVGWSSNGEWFGDDWFDAGTQAIESNTWSANANYLVGNASLGGLNWTRISDEWKLVTLPTNFRDLLKERLNSKQPGQKISCNDFIAQIIAKVAATFNKEGAARVSETNSRGQRNRPWVDFNPAAASGIDLVEKISTYTLVKNLTLEDHGAGGTVRGSIEGGDAEVLMAQKGYWFPSPRNTNPVRYWTNWYVGSAIHEIVHLAGNGFTDGRLAQAAYDLGFHKEKVANPDSNDVTEIFKNSGTWQDALAKYCGPR